MICKEYANRYKHHSNTNLLSSLVVKHCYSLNTVQIKSEEKDDIYDTSRMSYSVQTSVLVLSILTLVTRSVEQT